MIQIPNNNNLLISTDGNLIVSPVASTNEEMEFAGTIVGFYNDFEDNLIIGQTRPFAKAYFMPLNEYCTKLGSKHIVTINASSFVLQRACDRMNGSSNNFRLDSDGNVEFSVNSMPQALEFGVWIGVFMYLERREKVYISELEQSLIRKAFP